MGELAQTQVKPSESVGTSISGSLGRNCACGANTTSHQCDSCKSKGGVLQRKASARDDSSEVPPLVHEVLRSPGQPLDSATRAFFEPRFGHDFSQVRVHNDAKAAESARAVNALAYTVGRDVVFGMGRYAPTASEGQNILAHELVHVIQQNGAPGGLPGQLDTVSPDHATEREASETAQSVFNGNHGRIAQRSIPMQVQRILQPPLPRNPCPTSVRLGPVRQYNHGNISADRKERYRTYLSNIATMEVGPGPNHTGHCMQEVLTTVSNNCPASLTKASAPCSAFDCLPINNPMSFVDGHVTHNARSYLEGTGVDSCSVVCEQRYYCDSLLGTPARGVFRITRNYQADKYTRANGRKVHITTGTVDKIEVPQTQTPSPGILGPTPEPAPERTLPEGEELA
jgi:Domain of unknown function (DUF4157)